MSRTLLVTRLRNWWRRLSFGRRGRFILGVIVFLVTSYLFGWYIGRAVSPDYDTEEGARIFIAQHFRIINADRDVVLQVQFPTATYVYSLEADHVVTELPPAEKLASMKPPRRNLLEDQEKIFALAGIGALPSGALGGGRDIVAAAGTAPQAVRRLIIVGTAVLATAGGALGYRAGYDDAPDVNAPVFAKAIKDKENWRSFAVAVRKCTAIDKQVRAAAQAVERVRSAFPSRDLRRMDEYVDELRAKAQPCFDFIKLSEGR